MKTDQEILVKPWPKNPRYQVTQDGRVFTTGRMHRSGTWIPYLPMRELSRGICETGYWRVSVSINGKQRDGLCHRMVLESWVGPCPDGFQCAHLNGKRDDCRLENLRWVCPAENMFHQKAHGTALLGERNPSAKLTDIQALAVIVMRASGFGSRKIGKFFGVCRSTVQQVVSGEKYGHLRKPEACYALLKSKGIEVHRED